MSEQTIIVRRNLDAAIQAIEMLQREQVRLDQTIQGVDRKIATLIGEVSALRQSLILRTIETSGSGPTV